MGNVVSSAKTDMFRIRMNPEIREELERIYAKNGLTLTDAVNVFCPAPATIFNPLILLNQGIFHNFFRIYNNCKL